MKTIKFFAMAAAVAAMAGLSSCGDETKTDDANVNDEETTVVDEVSGALSELGDDVTDVTINEVEEVSESASSTSSAEIDEMLDKFESYVDKYISFAKKAANGDLSALAEYPALLQEAQELSDKIENVSGDMTPAQLARYQKIVEKMSTAAL